jgi:prepilin-type processing-associated H-X9-DG protein
MDGVIGVKRSRLDALVFTSYAYNAYGIAGLDGSPKLGLGISRLSSLAAEPEVLVPSEMFTVADTRTYRDLSIFPIGTVKGLCGRIEMQPYYSQAEETPPLHGKGYNILFGDSHVVLVKRSDYLFPPRTAHNWNRDNQPHQEAWLPRNEWAVQE